MKKALTKTISIYYIKDGVRIEGAPVGITGDLPYITGNLSYISGNLDECEITEKERKEGVSINMLVQEIQ